MNWSKSSSDTWLLIRGWKVRHGLMSEREQQVEEAVDDYHGSRRDNGWMGRKGGEKRREAERALAEAIERVYPYQEWLKRHD